ncbi:SSE1p ATPase component of heat shock protein Hsp90 chaperone complex, partial [Saccharomyces cerevisiae]
LRVRPFKFEDIHPYSVSYSWDKQVEDEDHMEVFPAGSSFPSTKLITLNQGQDSVPVKLKLRCDPSGLHTIEEAYTIEDIEVEEPIPLPEDAPEDAEQEFKKVTKTVKKDDLTIVAHTFGLDAKKLNELIEKENEMLAQDKLVAETEDRKNTLEEYIYTLRGKLEEEYAPFASDAEKTKLQGMLNKAEEWLR